MIRLTTGAALALAIHSGMSSLTVGPTCPRADGGILCHEGVLVCTSIATVRDREEASSIFRGAGGNHYYSTYLYRTIYIATTSDKQVHTQLFTTPGASTPTFKLRTPLHFPFLLSAGTPRIYSAQKKIHTKTRTKNAHINESRTSALSPPV
jgi:hypothetical protein